MATLEIEVQLDYAMDAPTDLLLQIEAAPTDGQTIDRAGIGLSPVEHFARVPGEEMVGDRIWMRVENRLLCDYAATVTVDRASTDVASLPMTPTHQLPGDGVRYLMASRYCPSDEFQTFAMSEFTGLSGGALIASMRDWIADKVAYVPGSSGPHTTALDTFVQRQGICRDFAHVMITLSRAMAIPARIASVYAPDVEPQDFHAVAQVYLDGAWHLVDPTGMSRAGDTVIVGIGADAADVAFLTSYGPAHMQRQVVQVRRA